MAIKLNFESAIPLVELEAMLVSPSIPANLLDRKVYHLAVICHEHKLDVESAEKVAYIMIEYSGMPSAISSFLGEGFSVEQVVNAYDTRNATADKEKGVHLLSTLLEAQEYFADSEDPEYFQSLLAELPKVYPMFDYCNIMLRVALDEAKERDIQYLGDLIERRLGRE